MHSSFNIVVLASDDQRKGCSMQVMRIPLTDQERKTSSESFSTACVSAFSPVCACHCRLGDRNSGTHFVKKPSQLGSVLRYLVMT